MGLYYDGIIARIPVYEDDLRYGSMIVGSPPFGVISIVLTPIFCCMKNEARIRRINDICTKILFAPIALILIVIFIGFNLILLPFGYLTAIYRKFQLVNRRRSKKQSETKESDRSTNALVVDLIIFILIGVLILLAS